MRIQVKGGFFRFTEKESLKENEDLQIVGYFKDNSLFRKVSDIYQPVYLINGKYYVEQLMNSPLVDTIMSIKSTYRDIGPAKSMLESFLYGISGLVNKEDFWKKNYALYEQKVGPFFEIENFSNSQIIRQEGIIINDDTFVIGIKLTDGTLVVGSEEFIEKVIIERISDANERYHLLHVLYANYHDYHKLDELIRDTIFNHYDELDDHEKYDIDKQKGEQDFIMFGLNILEDIKEKYEDVTIRRI